MKFCIEFVNITFKQGTLRLNEMYLQFMDNVAWISWGKQGNTSKYFCATAEIRRNCSLPPIYIRMWNKGGLHYCSYTLSCNKFWSEFDKNMVLTLRLKLWNIFAEFVKFGGKESWPSSLLNNIILRQIIFWLYDAKYK